MLLKCDYVKLKRNYVNKMVDGVVITTSDGSWFQCSLDGFKNYDIVDGEHKTIRTIFKALDLMDSNRVIFEIIRLFRDEGKRMMLDFAIIFKEGKSSKYILDIYDKDEKDYEEKLENKIIDEKEDL